MDTQKQEVEQEVPAVAVAGTVVMPASSEDAKRLQKLFAGWSGMNVGQRNAFKGKISHILNHMDDADGVLVATALEIQKWIDENAPPAHRRNGNGGATPAHFEQQFKKWPELDGHQQAGVKAALTKAIAKAPPEVKAQLEEIQALILAAPSNAKGKAKGTNGNLAQRYLDEGISGYKKLSLWSQPARKARVEFERKAALARGDTELAQKLADLHKQM